ncbi:hypothetical protein [Actinoplanes octamycinicus]|uniref:hypothetical protein n=1 Tax=Actinoplanes octamycinicus TaxID=135948 RepID=UPI0035ECC427
MPRTYRYVGPADVPASGGTGPGRPLSAPGPLAPEAPAAPDPLGSGPPPGPGALVSGDLLTYVVSPAGVLLLAPRNSEHVACAGGGPVLAAGEIGFRRDGDGWRVDQVTNQSTGYCPEPSCWPAVAAALDAGGVRHDDGFTTEFTFRRCPRCHAVNLVKEEVYVCDLCDADLPPEWNFA